MIVLRAVRVEETGEETELGEVRLTETGAGVFAHSSTPEGGPVIADVVERMRAPALLRPPVKVRTRFCPWCRGQRRHDRYCPTLDVQP